MQTEIVSFFPTSYPLSKIISLPLYLTKAPVAMEFQIFKIHFLSIALFTFFLYDIEYNAITPNNNKETFYENKLYCGPVRRPHRRH